MTKEDLARVRTVIASLMDDETKYKEQAAKDRLLDLVAYHSIAIRTLQKVAVIIEDMAQNYGPKNG